MNDHDDYVKKFAAQVDDEDYPSPSNSPYSTRTDSFSSIDNYSLPQVRPVTVGVKRTSKSVFESFIRQTPFGYDVSGILSEACYNEWALSHANGKSAPEEAFRKALIMQLTCADKTSIPFREEIESKILNMLRPKRVWECFKNRVTRKGKLCTIGSYGARCKGFHEKRVIGPMLPVQPRGRSKRTKTLAANRNNNK